jgi:ArsR family transcriptional regulator, arsenate/arsenite/antimonite-responsive transcriptional repressor / arsenate reductase (thioredoxin)
MGEDLSSGTRKREFPMSMSKKPKRVLFLCTGNSARSQMAEALLRHIGKGRFAAFSAGTSPRPQVHPDAIQTLTHHDIPSEGLVPKNVATFSGQSFDYVITLCDRAREVCPAFESAEMMHWTFHDPAEADAASRRSVFDKIFAGLSQRVRFLIIIDEKT